MKIFGRDPALLAGVAASAIQFLTLFLHLSTGWQGSVNGAIVALIGFAVAYKVHDGSAVPALVGIAKALLAVGLAFGLKWAPDLQVEAMALVTTLASFYVRTQVTALKPVAEFAVIPPAPGVPVGPVAAVPPQV